MVGCRCAEEGVGGSDGGISMSDHGPIIPLGSAAVRIRARTGMFQGSHSFLFRVRNENPRNKTLQLGERSSAELRFASFLRSIVRDHGRLSRADNFIDDCNRDISTLTLCVAGSARNPASIRNNAKGMFAIHNSAVRTKECGPASEKNLAFKLPKNIAHL